MEESVHSGLARWIGAALFVVFTVAVLVGGYAYYRTETERVRQEKYQEIAAIGKLKTGQIEQWRQERLGDSRRSSTAPFFVKAVQEWIAQPDHVALQQKIRDRLEIEQTEEGYSDVLLLATDGNVLIAVSPRPHPLSPGAKEAVEQALTHKTAVLSDLYRCPHGIIHLDAVAPVLGAEGKPIAVLVLRSNAESYLYPLIQSWPTPSRTAETLLVRKEGDDVLFLNDLRHRPDSALSLREPLTHRNLPAVQAILGKQGIFLGRDYRGKEVLADLLPVAGSRWFMVAKVDASEILAEVQYRGTIVVLFVALFIVVAASVTAFGYRHRQARLYRELYLSERKARIAQGEFRATLYSIGDAVITADTAGLVKEMNPVAERLVGWPEAEAKGKRLSDVFHIVNEETRAVLNSPVDRVLSEGVVLGLANHTLLISKSGSEYPIADSGAPILNKDGTIVGVVMVFRDQTQEREAENERNEREKRYRDLWEKAPVMLVSLDRNGRILFASDYFCEELGYDRDEVLDRTPFEFQTEQSSRYAQSVVFPQFLQQGTIRNAPLQFIKKNGDVIDVLLNVTAERDDRGTIIRSRSAFIDITDRKRAEAALEESEERFAKSFKNNPAWLAIVHVETRKLLEVNDAWTRLLGYTREEAIGRTAVELGIYDEETYRKIMEEAEAKGSVRNVEVSMKTRAGENRVLLASREVIGIKGEPYLLAMGLDITDRKHAEQESRLNERRLESLVRISQHAPKDFRNLLDYALDEALTLTGSTIGWFGSYTEEGKRLTILAWSSNAMEDGEVPPKSIVLSIHDAGIWAEGIRRREPFILNDCQNSNTNQTDWPRGCTELSRLLTVPIFSGGRIVAAATVGNKTDDYEKTDARQLTLFMDSVWVIARARRSEEAQRRLSTAIEQASEGVLITDPQGIVQYVNPALEKITGYRRDELIGRTPGILKSGEHDAAFYRHLWGTIRAGKTWSGHFTNRRKDGQLYQEEATISPVRDASGQIANFVAVKRDITEQLRLSSQLFQAQKMEAVGTLAGGVAHDFNNILQVVLGYSELMLSDEHFPERYREDLTRVHQTAGTGADLVQRLLTFSRKTEVKPRPLNLNRRIEQLQKMLSRTLPKMIEMELILADDLAAINADPTQMEQVLMNLAVNARDAMPEGGRLIIRTENTALDEHYCTTHLDVEPGRYVLLSVSDTGNGMDKDTAQHIFEPFFTTKGPREGTGLGLAMVYGIVKQHGGHITCYSEVSQGTVFSMYFPALVSEEEAITKESKGVLPGGSETILLVDDEQMIRDLGTRILTKAGYTVIAASNGKEALEVYRTQNSRISLVIMDLIMPEMGGKQCLENLLALDPSVRVVVASGYSLDGATKELLALGARGFVNKPYDMRQVLEIVRSVLDQGTGDT
jgi:two-component system, cell cycle sensor histidine kinase and response regulator CckA